MARDQRIEARLQRWAEAVTVGDGSGYAVVNPLHANWSPPTAGQRPGMKTARASDVRETHRAIGQLSVRLANTLVVHYCMRLPLSEQALRLECAQSTVLQRIDEAHGRLLAVLEPQAQEPVGKLGNCNKEELSYIRASSGAVPPG